MMPAVTISATTAKRMKGIHPEIPPPWLWRVVIRVLGARPMMPAKMISEMPLPMPCSVISSPNHISITVPPVSVMMIVARWNQSMSAGRMAGEVCWKSTVSP